MKTFYYINYIIILLFLIGCDNNEPEKKIEFPEYLIFGHYFGECTGEDCLRIYKFENDSLFEAEYDKIYNYPWFFEDDLLFNFIGNEKIQLIKDINYNIPNDLLETTDHLIGCPDCTDQGGYYLEYSLPNKQYYWNIDMDRKNVPNGIHSFLDLIDEKMVIMSE